MTEYVNGYSGTSDLYQWTQGHFPMGTALTEMLAPLAGSIFGTNFMPLLNMFRVNRQDRPFYEADTAMTLGLRNQFRQMTGGKPSTSGFQAFGRAIASYFMDDKGLAESALTQAARATGAGSYAFGTGGLSMADISGRWNTARYGSYNQNLVELMSGVYNMDFDPNLSKGQRQMMMAGMLRTDSTMLRDYAAMRRAADRLGYGGAWKQDQGFDRNLEDLRSAINQKGATDDATESLKKLVDRLDNTRKSIEAFGEAANTWGRVLRTDANTAMQRMQNLLGSDAFAMFRGNEAALAEMGLNVKHVGGMTGRGSDSVLALAAEAGKYLMARGGPADAAVSVATNAMMQSHGMAGYRVTQEGADKMMTRFMADAQTSDAGYLYFGGYQRFAEQQIAKGSKLSQRDMIRQWDQIVARNGLHVQTLNRALGLNYDINGYAAASQGDFGRDARVQQNGFNMLSFGNARIETMNRILLEGGVRNVNGSQMTYADVRRMSQRAGMDVMDLMGTSQDEFNYRVNQIQDPRLRQTVIRFRSRFGEAFRTMQRNNPGGLGALANSTANEAAAFLSDTNYQRSVRMDQQRERRAQISQGISGKTMMKSVGDMIRSNPNFSIGDILAAAGGDDMTYEELDAIHTIGADKETRAAVGQRLQQLGRSANAEQNAFFKETLAERMKKFAQMRNAKNADGTRKFSDDQAYYGSGLSRLLGGRMDSNGRIRMEEGTDVRSEEFQNDFNKWKDDKRQKAALMENTAKASFDKDLSQLNLVEKAELASRLALADIGKEEAGKKGGNKALSTWYRVALEGKVGSYVPGSGEAVPDSVQQAYEEARKAKINTSDFEKRKAEYMEQMGVQNDQASTAAIMAQVAEQVVKTISSTFGKGGSDAFNVRDMTP